MLSVPSSIYEAYNTIVGTPTGITSEDRHKEIRIKFPNGEYRDLWNYDIVQESFSFTESVCSSDSFKFGLCEAAEVSFEVVGIEINFAGCKIEVYAEIDVSDLEQAEQCAGRYVSEPVPVYDPESGQWITPDKDEHNCYRGGDEVSRGVYSIPIGVFTVIECQRSKSDMTHRSVRAITKVFETNDDMTPFEQWRIAQLHRTKTFTMPIPNYVDCQIGKPSDPTYEGKLVEYNMNYFSPGNSSHKDSCFIHAGTRRVFVHKGKLKLDKYGNHVPVNDSIVNEPAYGQLDWDENYSDGINYSEFYYSIKVKQYALYHIIKTIKSPYKDYYDTYEHFKSYLIQRIKDAYSDSIGTLNEITPEDIDNLFNSEYFDETELKSFYNECLFRFGVWYSNKRGSSFNALDNEWVMPYDAALRSKDSNEYGRFMYTNVFRVWIKKLNGGSFAIQRTIDDIFPYDIYGPVNQSTGTGIYEPKIKLKFDHTLDTKDGTYRYSFYNAFTMRDIITGWLEINAQFGHQKRNGKYEYMNLGDQEGMRSRFYKHQFEKLYYEEFDIDDIGYVIYKYKKNKDDKEVEVIFDLKTGGTSVYDMTDNSIFSKLDEDETITDKQLKTKIQTYLTEFFKPNLDCIHYYPAEITLHSKPFLEAGDKYYISTSPGSIYGSGFYTYNLNMTLSGIQNTKTDISSTSGQLIDGASLGVEEEEDDT